MGIHPDNFGLSTQICVHQIARQSRAEQYNELYRQKDSLGKSIIPKNFWKIYNNYLKLAALPVMLGTKIPAPPQQLAQVIKNHYNPKSQQQLKAWLNRQAEFDRIKVKVHEKFRKTYSGKEYNQYRR